MVNTVQGIIAGKPISFTKNDEGTWLATIPYVSTGTYVVELFATDEAGNQSYFATILYTVDVDNLQYNVEFTEFACEENKTYMLNANMTDYELTVARFTSEYEENA